MGEENEAQEGKDGVELTRTHGLNVEDMTRGSEEGLNSGALVVEVESRLDGELFNRQIGIEQGIFGVSVRQPEFVQQTPYGFFRGDFNAMHLFRHGQPMVQRNVRRQAGGGAAVPAFEEEIARHLPKSWRWAALS